MCSAPDAFFWEQSRSTELFAKEKGAPSALADQLKNCSKGDDGDTDAEKREFFEETRLDRIMCVYGRDSLTLGKVTDFREGMVIRGTQIVQHSENCCG